MLLLLVLTSHFHLFSQEVKPTPIVEIKKPFHHLNYLYQGNTVTAPQLMRILKESNPPEPVLREIKIVHRIKADKVSLIIVGFGIILPEALAYGNTVSHLNYGSDRLPYWALFSAPTLMFEGFACLLAVIQQKHNHKVIAEYNQSIK